MGLTVKREIIGQTIREKIMDKASVKLLTQCMITLSIITPTQPYDDSKIQVTSEK